MKSRTLVGLSALGFAFVAVLVDGCSSSDSSKPPDGVSDASTTPPLAEPLACPEEHADCDHNRTNGCESIVSVDVQNCGGCSHICGNDHGTPTCDRRLCKFACEPDWANCDGDDANGCESHLPADPANCNGCNLECPAGPNQRATCTDGVCGVECYPGTADCNGQLRDGCESSLESPEACGSCQHRCGKFMGVPGCKSAACQWNCDGTYAHCGADDSTGCDTNLLDDPLHCGDCATVCPADKPRCSNRTCTT